MAFNASLNVIGSAFVFFLLHLSTGPKLYSVHHFQIISKFTTEHKILFYCLLTKIRSSCALTFSSDKWHNKILHTVFFSNNKNTSILIYNTTLHTLSGPEPRKLFENVDVNILSKKTVIYYSWKTESSILHDTCSSNLNTSFFFLLICLIDWNYTADNHISKNRYYMKSLEYFSYWNPLYMYLTYSIYTVRWVTVYMYTQKNFGFTVW